MLKHLLLLLVLAAAWGSPGEAAPRQAGASRPAAGEPDTPVNINTAGLAALVTLKGVGEKKARAILNFRKSHGPFRSLDDFEAVPGIGPALIERNRDRIIFSGPEPGR
ncbi:MAG TPA: ComEA family DNA-binding protein [Moraxellaceae bacterium]|nr:ComEA family DNA-binding protein [Moraxellaceae bacterium]